MGNESSTTLKQVVEQTDDKEILRLANVFLNQQIPAEKFYNFIQPEDIRKIIRNNLNQFAIFLSIVIYNIYEVSSKQYYDHEVQYHLSNNLRVLIRVIPILHEAEFQAIAEEIYWIQTLITRDQNLKNLTQGIALCEAVKNLLFLQKLNVTYSNIPWEYIHKTEQKSLNNKFRYCENRILVLQVLLALFGANLYQPNYAQGYLNPFIAYFNSPQNGMVELLFQSMLAVTTKHKESGFLPYQSLKQTNQLKHQLACLTAQVASILICEPLENWKIAQQNIEQSDALINIYNQFVKSIDAKEEYQNLPVIQKLTWIFQSGSQILVINEKAEENMESLAKNILTLLENPIKFDAQILLDSFAKIEFTEELLILFYKWSILNENFFNFINNSPELRQKLFKILMYYFCQCLDQLEANNQTALNSPFFIVIAILIHYSNTEQFCSMLSEELDFSFPQLKCFPVVGGNKGDLIVNVISQSLINCYSQGIHHSIYNQMAILVNVSAFLSDLSDNSCHKLMKLLQICSDYSFLMQDFSYPLCLVKLICVFDNILVLKNDNNSNFILELCKNSKWLNMAFKINFQEDQLRAIMGDKQAQELIMARNFKHRKENRNSQTKSVKLPFEDEEKKTINVQESLGQKNKGFASQMPEHQKEKLIQIWREFNWGQYRAQMPTKNIQAVLLMVESYLKENNILVLTNDLVKEINSKKGFNSVVQQTDSNNMVENFSGNPKVEERIRQICWMNLYCKSVEFPFFDPQKCLYCLQGNFQFQQQLIKQRGGSNDSLDVHHPSEQEIMEANQQQFGGDGQMAPEFQQQHQQYQQQVRQQAQMQQNYVQSDSEEEEEKQYNHQKPNNQQYYTDNVQYQIGGNQENDQDSQEDAEEDQDEEQSNQQQQEKEDEQQQQEEEEQQQQQLDQEDEQLNSEQEEEQGEQKQVMVEEINIDNEIELEQQNIDKQIEQEKLQFEKQKQEMEEQEMKEQEQEQQERQQILGDDQQSNSQPQSQSQVQSSEFEQKDQNNNEQQQQEQEQELQEEIEEPQQQQEKEEEEEILEEEKEVEQKQEEQEEAQQKEEENTQVEVLQQEQQQEQQEQQVEQEQEKEQEQKKEPQQNDEPAQPKKKRNRRHRR